MMCMPSSPGVEHWSPRECSATCHSHAGLLVNVSALILPSSAAYRGSPFNASSSIQSRSSLSHHAPARGALEPGQRRGPVPEVDVDRPRRRQHVRIRQVRGQPVQVLDRLAAVAGLRVVRGGADARVDIARVDRERLVDQRDGAFVQGHRLGAPAGVEVRARHVAVEQVVLGADRGAPRRIARSPRRTVADSTGPRPSSNRRRRSGRWPPISGTRRSHRRSGRPSPFRTARRGCSRRGRCPASASSAARYCPRGLGVSALLAIESPEPDVCRPVLRPERDRALDRWLRPRPSAPLRACARARPRFASSLVGSRSSARWNSCTASSNAPVPSAIVPRQTCDAESSASSATACAHAERACLNTSGARATLRTSARTRRRGRRTPERSADPARWRD